MNHFRSTRFIAVASSAGLMGLSLNANAINIDLFSQPDDSQQIVTASNIGDDDASTYINLDGSILGGARTLYVKTVDGPAGEATTKMLAGLGFLSFDTGSLVTGYGEIVWDGGSGYEGGEFENIPPDYTPLNLIDYTGLDGVDLTDNGALTGFLVTTLFADLGWNFEVIAYTDADNWTQINFQATEVPAGAGPVSNFIPFADFMNPGLCGLDNPSSGVNSIRCAPDGNVVDFTNLGALAVRLNVGEDGSQDGGTVSVDLTLTDITTTIPEPATLGLLGMGLLAAGGMLGLRRRNQLSV